MIIHGISLAEGSNIKNATITSGASFPEPVLNPPDVGELFYINNSSNGFNIGLYVYEGTNWVRLVDANNSNEFMSSSAIILYGSSFPQVSVDGELFYKTMSDLAGQAGLYYYNTSDYPAVWTSISSSNVEWTSVINTPTTLNGYGITNGQPLNNNLSSISNLSGNSGLLRTNGLGSWVIDATTYLSANQTITLNGDIVGSGNTLITASLTDSGVIPGTYNIVTVDSKGRITAGANISPGILTSYYSGVIQTTQAVTSLISFSNDFFGSAVGDGTQQSPASISIQLNSTGVIAGTYNSVTVDSKGRVIAGSNITLVSSLAALTDVALSTPSFGDVLTYNGSSWDNISNLNLRNKSIIAPVLVNYSEKLNTIIPSSSTLSIDIASGCSILVNMNQNISTVSISNSAGWSSNSVYAITLIMVQGSSSYTIAWPSSFKWDSGVSVPLSTSANAIDVYNLISYNQGSTWLAFPAAQSMS